MATIRYAKANKEIKRLVSQFRDSYDSMCESSRNEYMKTLSPGFEVPDKGMIYGEKNRNEFSSMCKGYRERSRKIIGDVIKAIQDTLTDGPSTDAVNSVNLLNMRKNITMEEVQELLDRYGDNPQIWTTIKSIATEHKLFIGEHPLYEQLAECKSLDLTMEKTLTLPNPKSYSLTKAYYALLDMQIDKALPIEDGEK